MTAVCQGSLNFSIYFSDRKQVLNREVSYTLDKGLTTFVVFFCAFNIRTTI
ncbi:hypothetical protein ABIB30_005517 [Pedobacter sp. UYP1]